MNRTGFVYGLPEVNKSTDSRTNGLQIRDALPTANSLGLLPAIGQRLGDKTNPYSGLPEVLVRVKN